MSENRILHWSIILCYIIIVINVLMFSLFLFLVLMSFTQSPITQGIGLTEGYKTTEIAQFTLNSEDSVSIDDIPTFMKLWLLLRSFIFTFIIIAIILRIKKIISSITSLQTFYRGNIDHFMKLARLGLIYALFASFNLSIEGNDSDLFLSFPLGPLAFALACLVLANVFKEGKNLLDDKNSII